LKEKPRNVQISLEKMDEAYLSIGATLNYAKRFQDAILPSKEKFKRNFTDHFVLFKPKEVVSGDFYWLAELEDDKIILAVLDCTGHGIPGAFMTLLGFDLLHEIVQIQKITEPDKILRTMHLAIRKILRQQETHNTDGMDAAICLIDKKNQRIEYAGAHNPLLYVHHRKPELIKADKFAVGGYEKEGERVFTKKIIPFNKSDNNIIYLFTDGYQDQIGGTSDRRFMASRLRRILFEMSHKPLNKQKKILEKVIDFWMKGKKQMDDMLLIGIKI
jgi:serine phosphatase RsbU (regulator of sigma subunit)